jgi:uncharacterized protein (TIRG00374 family)
VLLGLQRLFSVLRWQIILDVHGVRSSFLELTKITLVSHSFGYMSPGGIGIEVARVYQAGAAYGAIPAAISSVLLDRLIGLFSMLATALVMGLALAPAAPELWPIVWGCALAIVALVSFVAVINTEIGRQTVSWLPGRLFKRLKPSLDKLVASLAEHGRNLRLLAPITSLSLLMQIVRALTIWVIFRSMGTDVALLHCLVFVPLVFVLLAAPVSVGGLGVREGALAFFFAYVGVPAEESVAAGLVMYALQLVFVVPGLLIFLTRPGTVTSSEHPHRSMGFRPPESSS